MYLSKLSARPFVMLPLVALTLAVLSVYSISAVAESYAYLIEGEHGEAAFSDLPSDHATTLTLVESVQAPLSSAEQVEQMLRIAEELALARREREALRQEQRREQQRALAARHSNVQEQQQPATRTPYYAPYFPARRAGHGRPGHSGRGSNRMESPMQSPAEPQAPTRPERKIRYRPNF